VKKIHLKYVLTFSLFLLNVQKQAGEDKRKHDEMIDPVIATPAID
jgi:hypothetical protein